MLVILALSATDVGDIGSKQPMLVTMAQSTADIGDIGSKYSRCW